MDVNRSQDRYTVVHTEMPCVSRRQMAPTAVSRMTNLERPEEARRNQSQRVRGFTTAGERRPRLSLAGRTVPAGSTSRRTQWATLHGARCLHQGPHDRRSPSVSGIPWRQSLGPGWPTRPGNQKVSSRYFFASLWRGLACDDGLAGARSSGAKDCNRPRHRGLAPHRRAGAPTRVKLLWEKTIVQENPGHIDSARRGA